MAYTKRDLMLQGAQLRNNLETIGNTIKSNKINEQRNQRLERYNNFASVTQGMSPEQINSAMLPDLLWLSANGFKDDTKTLMSMTESYAKNLDLKKKNETFINLLPSSEKSKFANADLSRVDVGDVYSQFDKTVDKPLRPRATKVIDLKDRVIVRTFNADDTYTDEEIDKGNPIHYTYNMTPDNDLYVDPETGKTSIKNTKTAIGTNSIPYSDAVKEEQLKIARERNEIAKTKKKKTSDLLQFNPLDTGRVK